MFRARLVPVAYAVGLDGRERDAADAVKAGQIPVVVLQHALVMGLWSLVGVGHMVLVAADAGHHILASASHGNQIAFALPQVFSARSKSWKPAGAQMTRKISTGTSRPRGRCPARPRRWPNRWKSDRFHLHYLR